MKCNSLDTRLFYYKRLGVVVFSVEYVVIKTVSKLFDW